MSAWILFMLQGVEETAIWTNARISAIRRLSEHTASQYLKQLVEIGVLEERVVGKEKLFLHPKLLQLLTQEEIEFVPYGE